MSTPYPLALPVQGTLFDTGIDFAKLRMAEEEIMRNKCAQNTTKAFEQSWGIWADWCAAAGRDPFPGTPESVRAFITWALTERKPRYRVASVNLVLWAIRRRCRAAQVDSPITDSVRALVEASRRSLRERPGGKAALPIEHLRTICSTPCEQPTEYRNRALVLTGFAVGSRCSELVTLSTRDLSFSKKGALLYLPWSKTDQTAEGAYLGIPFGGHAQTCPVRALQAWLKVRGSRQGPLFCRISNHQEVLPDTPLRPPAVSTILKDLLRAHRIDPKPYASHSLRAGFVTAASENGASESAIMRRTRHTQVQTVLRYVRPTRAFATDPLRGVL